jgi:hypothetical protein
MRIKKYSDFLLESQLIYKDEFKSILYAIRNDEPGSPESKVASILLELSGVELDLVHNYIKDVTTPGLVSFIPEDKINFNKVSIEQHRIVTKTSILSAYGISKDGLINNEEISLIGTNDFPNDFKLIKTIDTDLAELEDEMYRLEGYYLYYLQSNSQPDRFVTVYRNINDGDTQSIYPYEIPENRRGEVKIGRFVNKLIDIYKKSGNDQSIIDGVTAAAVEKFVNAYTARILFEENAFSRFEIVKGEEIKKWYHESNYAGQGGQLNSSCMRFGRCQDFFKIYTENPEVCQLLILKDETGKKIEGRALLWTTVDGKKFMDRIYTTKDSLVKLFAKWAEDNSYINKGQETHNYRTPLLDTIIVQVKPKLYPKYPYMDTLIDYVPDKGILCNRIDVETLMKFPDIRKKTRIEDFKKFFSRKKDGSAHFSIDGKDITIYKLNDVGGGYGLY